MKTDWLAALGGAILLSSAAGSKLAPGILIGDVSDGPRLASFIQIVLASVVLATHTAFRWRRIFTGLSVASALVFFGLGAWILGFGLVDVGLFHFLIGASLALAGYARVASKAATPTRDLNLLQMTSGVFLVLAALVPPAVRAFGSMISTGLDFAGLPAVLAAALGLTIGAAMCRDALKPFSTPLWRMSLAAASAAFFAVMGYGYLTAGFVGTSIGFLAAALFTAWGMFHPDHGADPGADLTQDQKDIREYEQIGETGVWAIGICAGLFVFLSPQVNHAQFFLSLLAVFSVTIVAFHGLPARMTGRDKYFLTLAGIVISFMLMGHATGGLASPFGYFSFVAMLAASAVLSAQWLFVISFLLIFYYVFELFWSLIAVAAPVVETVNQFVFLSAAILVTLIYTTVIGRKRRMAEASVIESKQALERALETSEREKVRAKNQAESYRQLGEEQSEMRSALMNVLEDVEESKHQTERDHLRDSAIFSSIEEGLVAAYKDGSIFLFNPVAAKVTGTGLEAALGRNIETILKFMPEDGDVLEAGIMKEALEGKGAVLPERLTLLRTDGQRVPVSGTVAPFFDETSNLKGLVVAFRDVTIQRDIDRQKSGFISIASHQLRTPLSGIRWFLDLLLGGDAGKVNKAQKDFLQDMYTSTVRMIRLVNDLLNVSRLESGRVAMNPVPIDIKEMLESLGREHQPLIEKKKLKFTIKAEKSLPKVVADTDAIRQAVANLIANAINYTPEGGSVSVSTTKTSNEVIVSVIDNGIGIPKGDQHRVFEKFFRAQNAVSRETVGSGLGLNITKQMVESAGGSIWFESKEGKGTTFFIALPASRKDATLKM